MSTEKPPAFQFYPRDWDTDENVIPMTYEEEGVYWALCRRYWLSGNTLPNDIDALRLLLKSRPSLTKMQKWWKVIGPCFPVVDGKLTQKRLDRERVKQIENKTKRQKAADERWKKEQERKVALNAHASALHSPEPVYDDAMLCLASASAFASSIATADESQQQQQPAASPSESPRRVDRSHAGHVFGFCTFKCLSEEKIQEFSKDLPRGLNDPHNFERVTQWAKSVRDGWGDKPKMEPRWYDFWQARWAERVAVTHDHGSAAMAEAEARRQSVRGPH